MTKIFIYAANPELAAQTAQTLKAAGAEHAEALTSLSISARQPKEHRYLFICETPAEKLASLVEKELPENEYAEVLGQWYTTQTEILDTYQSQKKRAVLISTTTLHKNVDIIPRLNNTWDLKLNIGETSKAEADEHAQSEALLAYLVQNLVQQTPPLQQLAESVAKGTGEEPDFYTESEAIAAYRNFKNIKSGYRQEIEATKSQLTQLQSLQEESEMILLQLHQVQEELERIYLEYQAYKETTEQEKAELSAAHDHQAHIAHEREQEIGRLHQEKADLTAARDHHAHIAHEREQEIGRLHQEKADLTAARDHHAHIAHEREQEIGRLHQEKADLTAARDAQANAAKDSSEEAELLLNQLHQVQEELEHYFIKYKEADLLSEKQQNRWQKILASYPDYVAYESIKATTIDPDKNTLSWSITGLENTNISRPQLEFETFIEAGVLGFRFIKDSGEKQSGLKIWPEFAKDLNVLEIIPVGKGETKALRAKTLKALSGSDWQLIQALPKLIEQVVKDGSITLNEQQNFTEALQKFTGVIQLFPKALRYDAVTLKNNQVNPDYEHLWFVLENMSFGDRYWSKFEIRLGAANIQPNGFSMHPKIEIPLIDGKIKPFDSWFEEAKDDFGPKFEIRFDTAKKICDTETRDKLDTGDKDLVRMLARAIPNSIKKIDIVHIKNNRSLQEWASLAKPIADVLG